MANGERKRPKEATAKVGLVRLEGGDKGDGKG